MWTDVAARVGRIQASMFFGEKLAGLDVNGARLTFVIYCLHANTLDISELAP